MMMSTRWLGGSGLGSGWHAIRHGQINKAIRAGDRVHNTKYERWSKRAALPANYITKRKPQSDSEAPGAKSR